MKNIPLLIVTIVSTLSITPILRAQDAPVALGSERHDLRHRLIDLGTFGGPNSAETEEVPYINNAGMVVGFADTSIPDSKLPRNLSEFILHVQRNRSLNGMSRPVASQIQDGAKVYSFSTTDFPGAAGSTATDRNDARVVGYFFYGDGPTNGMAFGAGNYRTLNYPGAQNTFPQGINSSGQVVGYYSDNSGLTHGFTMLDGVFTSIDPPGGLDTVVYDVSDAGQIVGGSFLPGGTGEHGFIDSSGSYAIIDFPGAQATSVNGINTPGDVVGTWLDGASIHGFLLRAGVFSIIDVPFATNTLPTGINDKGEIAGSYTDGNNRGHGFLYSDGAFSEIDLVGASDTAVMRIKNNGQIVGFYVDLFGESHGIVGR